MQPGRVVLAVGEPSFSALLRASLRWAVGKLRRTPAPEAQGSAPCVHGGWAEIPGEPDSHVRRGPARSFL